MSCAAGSKDGSSPVWKTLGGGRAIYVGPEHRYTWYLPPGTPAGRYLGGELDHRPLLLLLIIFLAHDAGKMLGLN